MAFPGDYAPFIWTLLLDAFDGNEYAVAGAMGWMYGESYLDPVTCEGDVVDANRQASHTVVSRVDALGASSRGAFTGSNADGSSSSKYYTTWWVNGRRYGPGFGLAQWTGTGRKTSLWKYWRENFPNSTIANFVMQVGFIEHEMKASYPTCFREMTNATSVYQAMHSWGYWYEGWGAQTDSVVYDRIGWANQIYEMYTGKKPPVPPQPPQPFKGRKGLKIWQMIDYDK